MATLTELTVRQVGQVAPPLKQRLAWHPTGKKEKRWVAGKLQDFG